MQISRLIPIKLLCISTIFPWHTWGTPVSLRQPYLTRSVCSRWDDSRAATARSIKISGRIIGGSVFLPVKRRDLMPTELFACMADVLYPSQITGMPPYSEPEWPPSSTVSLQATVAVNPSTSPFKRPFCNPKTVLPRPRRLQQPVRGTSSDASLPVSRTGLLVRSVEDAKQSQHVRPQRGRRLLRHQPARHQAGNRRRHDPEPVAALHPEAGESVFRQLRRLADPSPAHQQARPGALHPGIVSQHAGGPFPETFPRRRRRRRLPPQAQEKSTVQHGPDRAQRGRIPPAEAERRGEPAVEGHRAALPDGSREGLPSPRSTDAAQATTRTNASMD